MSIGDAEEVAGRRVLVTGATGFIGRHLVRALVAAGGRPHLVLRPAAAVGLDTGPWKVHAADLGDPSALMRVVRAVRPEIVLHLGAYTDPARDLARGTLALRVNLEATTALAGALLEVGCSTAFVAAGTSEEYGHQAAPFHEEMPMQPLSPYSATKAAATLWLQMLHRMHGLPTVVVRPFLCYGPGQAPPKLVPTAMRAALAGEDFPMTSGRQRRELTYVEDVVAGILAAALRPAAQGRVINLGSGAERTVLSIVERIYALAGAGGRPLPGALPDRPGDMQRFAADPRLAQALLGWQAHTPLDAGLERSIAWVRRHGAAPVPLIP